METVLETYPQLNLAKDKIIHISNGLKTRIQLTLKHHSKNIKGESANFLIHNIPSEDIYNLLAQSLGEEFSGTRGPYTVRVQLTEYEKGSYKKSVGNFQVKHDCIVCVRECIQEVLDEMGALIS